MISDLAPPVTSLSCVRSTSCQRPRPRHPNVFHLRLVSCSDAANLCNWTLRRWNPFLRSSPALVSSGDQQRRIHTAEQPPVLCCLARRAQAGIETLSGGKEGMKRKQTNKERIKTPASPTVPADLGAFRPRWGKMWV